MREFKISFFGHKSIKLLSNARLGLFFEQVAHLPPAIPNVFYPNDGRLKLLSNGKQLPPYPSRQSRGRLHQQLAEPEQQRRDNDEKHIEQLGQKTHKPNQWR